jgi:hypothetical protein
MKPKEFIFSRLDILALKFPNVTFKYFFDDEITTHIIELTPEEEYNNNTQLDNAWIPIALEFDQLYKQESISFISSDSILAVVKPEKIWNGYNANTFEFFTNKIFHQVLVTTNDFILPNNAPKSAFESGIKVLTNIETSAIKISRSIKVLGSWQFDNGIPVCLQNDLIPQAPDPVLSEQYSKAA